MDRRDFLRMSSAVATLPAVKSVEAARLGPEDVVVVVLSHPLTDKRMATLKGLLKKTFPHNRGLILPEGTDLKVMRGL